jgi:glutathione S-transferase
MRFAIFEKDKGLAEAGIAYAKWFHKRLVKVEQRLADREFLCADRFTVADICVGYALILAESVGLDEGVPESLKAYRARLTARKAYQRAIVREEAGRAALESKAG